MLCNDILHHSWSLSLSLSHVLTLMCLHIKVHARLHCSNLINPISFGLQMRLDEVSVITEFVDASRSRKSAELARKRTEREM